MTVAVNDFKDGLTFTGAVGNVGPFTILGGKYLYFVSASGTTQSLDMLFPDGSTYVNYSTGTTLTTSGAVVVVDLPPGTYRFTISSASAVQGGLVRIPYRQA